MPAPSEPETGPQSREEVVLKLGDILPRVPVHLLRPGPHDGSSQVRFSVDELAEKISRGRVSVPLERLASVCPGVFRDADAFPGEQEIQLPLQKLLEQVGLNAPKAPSPNGVPGEQVAQARSQAERIVTAATTAAAAAPAPASPAGEPAPSAAAPAAEPAPAAAAPADWPPAAPPLGGIARSISSAIRSLFGRSGDPAPQTSTTDETAAPKPAPEPAKAVDQPSAQPVPPGCISLRVLPIFRLLPGDVLRRRASLPPVDARVNLPLAGIEPQLAEGHVEIPIEEFIKALPDSLQGELNSVPGVKVWLPLDEIFQSLPPDHLFYMPPLDLIPEPAAPEPAPVEPASEKVEPPPAEPAVPPAPEPAPVEPASEKVEPPPAEAAVLPAPEPAPAEPAAEKVEPPPAEPAVPPPAPSADPSSVSPAVPPPAPSAESSVPPPAMPPPAPPAETSPPPPAEPVPGPPAEPVAAVAPPAEPAPHAEPAAAPPAEPVAAVAPPAEPAPPAEAAAAPEPAPPSRAPWMRGFQVPPPRLFSTGAPAAAAPAEPVAAAAPPPAPTPEARRTVDFLASQPGIFAAAAFVEGAVFASADFPRKPDLEALRDFMGMFVDRAQETGKRLGWNHILTIGCDQYHLTAVVRESHFVVALHHERVLISSVYESLISAANDLATPPIPAGS